ncbi:MAG: hypothetical protein LUO90_04780 [Methanoregula sp.]|nr:hypothetical protein [Methanoregula sp.]
MIQERKFRHRCSIAWDCAPRKFLSYCSVPITSFYQSPHALALLVAVCTMNAFILLTHQVNAILMGPGGYP